MEESSTRRVAKLDDGQLLHDLEELVEAVLRSEGRAAEATGWRAADTVGVRMVPPDPAACPVEVWAAADSEQIGLVIGPLSTPYEAVFLDLRDPGVWTRALDRLRALVTAIIRGAYCEHRVSARNGSVLAVRLEFELPAGKYRYWARRSWRPLIHKHRTTTGFNAYPAVDAKARTRVRESNS